MIITKEILDELTEKAKASPRLRCNLDLRNSAEDQSQRMLNALEPGTIMPIHRHKGSSETCVCVRGHFEEYFYDTEGRLTETVDMVPGGVVLNIEKGQWHSLRCLESGTILLEAKDGGIGRWMKMKFGKRIKIKEIVKGVWAFCVYPFVPQRRARDCYE